MATLNFSKPAALFIILAVTCLLYINSFNAAFHFDDIPKIVENKGVRDIANVPRFFHGAGGEYLLKEYEFRPLKYATLALNYSISGYSTWSYHLFNLLLHLINSLLVFLAVRHVQRQPGDGGYAALLAASVFALHPIETSTVMYMANGRGVMLASMFFLLGFISFVRYRAAGRGPARYAWGALSPVFYLLGLLSKEIAGTLPAVLLTYELIFTARGRGGPKTALKGLLHYVPFAVVLAVFLGWKYKVHGYLAVQETPFGPYEYLLSESKAMLLYMRLMLLPVNQNADYYLPLTRAFDLKAATGLCTVAAAFLSLFLIRKKHPEAAFFGLWALIAIAPESSVVSFEDIAVEYRLYLPSVGLIAAASVLAAGRPLPARPRLGLGLAVLVLALFGLLTFTRTSVWATEYTFWRDAAAKAPHSPRAHLNLGVALLTEKRYTEAIDELVRSLKADPNYRQAKDAHYQLGICYADTGRLDEAALQFEAVLKTDPGYMNSYGRLGEAYFGLGRYGDATRVYREAVRRNPGDPAIRYNLAVSYVMLKRYEEARALMEPLTAEIPRSYELRYSLAGTYEKLGMGERALEQARLALDMAGDDEEKGSAALLVTRLRAK